MKKFGMLLMAFAMMLFIGFNYVNAEETDNKEENKTTTKVEIKSAKVTSKTVELDWNAVAKAKNYKVYISTKKIVSNKNGKKTEKRVWEKLGETTKTTYKKTGLKPYTTYAFKVVAYDNKGKKIVGSSIQGIKTKLAKSELKIKKIKSTSMTVYISKIKHATKYVLVRSTDNKEWTKVAELTKSGNYTDKNLTAGTKYYYKVKACDKDNICGPYSRVASTNTKLKTPVIDKITYNKSQKKVAIRLESSVDVTGYEVYRSKTKTSGFTFVKNSGFTITTDKKFKNGTVAYPGKGTYYYKVRAFKKVGKKKIFSKYSKVVSITIK